MTTESVPDATTLKFLEGMEVLQVCVGLYQLQLNFDRGGRIAIECELTIDGIRQEGFAAAIKILGAIGKKVQEVVVTPQAELSIQFHDGPRIIFHKKSGGFESFRITGPDGLYVF